MQNLIQWLCVLLVSVGAGLNAFSSKLEPSVAITDVAALSWRAGDYESREQHMIAAVTAGIGIGLMTLGGFGLVKPAVGRLLSGSAGAFSDQSARVMASIAIWISVAVALTLGVFRVVWAGAAGTAAVLLIVTMLCASGVAATAMVLGWCPWIRGNSLPRSSE